MSINKKFRKEFKLMFCCYKNTDNEWELKFTKRNGFFDASRRVSNNSLARSTISRSQSIAEANIN